MPINNINVGTAPDNGTGESLRLGGQKINANFTYLKSYIDNLIQGLKWKQKADLATTANVALTGEQTIDGVVTSASRILVKNQTNKTENGIYTTGAGAWIRTLDADLGSELVNATVSVVSGTLNANTNWTCNAESITIGTTDITFVSFKGADGVDQGTFDAAIQLINDELDTKLNKGTYTGTATDLETLANSKETPTGAQAKADAAEANAKAYSDSLDHSGTSNPSESGESIFFLEDEADPSIAGYKVMDNPAQLLNEAYITQSTIAEGQIVQEWITDVGLPKTTFIPSGVWLFHVNAYKTGGSKEARLYNEIYKRNEAGTETLLGTTSDSILLTDSEVSLPSFNIYIDGQTLLETDRLVTKTRMRLGTGGSDPTSVSVGYSGTTGARLSIPAQKETLNYTPANDAEVVKSVTGSGVDNTDPQNPIINATPYDDTVLSQRVTDLEGNSYIIKEFTALSTGANQVFTFDTDFYQIADVHGSVGHPDFTALPPNQIQITTELTTGETIKVGYWTDLTGNNGYVKIANGAIESGNTNAVTGGDVFNSFNGITYEFLEPADISTERAVINSISSIGSINAKLSSGETYGRIRLSPNVTTIKYKVSSLTRFFTLAGDATSVLNIDLFNGASGGYLKRYSNTINGTIQEVSVHTMVYSANDIVRVERDGSVYNFYKNDIFYETIDVSVYTQTEWNTKIFGWVIVGNVDILEVSVIKNRRFEYLENKVVEIETKGSVSYSLDEIIPSENIYDINDIELDVAVNTNGTTTASGLYFATGFMKVEPSTQYAVDRAKYRTYAYFDSSFVNVFGGTDMGSNLTFTTPSNAAYIRISCPYASFPSRNLIIRKGAVQLGYVPFGDTTLRLENTRFKHPLSGKTICTDGDSITAQERWQYAIMDKIPMIHINKGVGGTTLTGASGIAGNTRLSALPTADLYILNGGMNDWRNNLAIGVYGDSTTATLYGALKVYSDFIRTNFPNAILIMHTIPFAMKTPPSILNAGGKTTFDYSEAIREHCAKNNILCSDINSDCGWDENNITAFVDTESGSGEIIHPNLIGGVRIAGVTMNEINKYQ